MYDLVSFFFNSIHSYCGAKLSYYYILSVNIYFKCNSHVACYSILFTNEMFSIHMHIGTIQLLDNRCTKAAQSRDSIIIF